MLTHETTAAELADAAAPDADLAGLSYERARDDLMAVVQQLESGTATLAQSIELWQRGEKLAAHCQRLLESARAAVTGAADMERPAGGDPAP
ncbi:MAG: exodeoxyribonuclease VII small subunit [Propionibacteriaceae bacterium]|jgi:exodeoxyribonuclease VII small subunit|nr:exodeoxyribonuclease VII small subunit [Propionibacteriaceae bacterium]